MNRLVIIGNGFDLAHGLKTSYMDFINWYWEQKLNALLIENSAILEDWLCRLEIKDVQGCGSWHSYFYSHSLRDILTRKWKYPPFDIICAFKENTDDFSVTFSPFLETILQSIETRGWVDIENDYYELLKRSLENANCNYTVKELNKQLDYLKVKLVEYLGTIKCNDSIPTIGGAIRDSLHTEDLSTEWKGMVSKNPKNLTDHLFTPKHLSIERTMLLVFNYTDTAKMYVDDNISINYIHGELEHPEHIIFGYGDELDKSYPDLRDKNDNELLRNVKSVKYLETRRYRELLEFLMAAPFQVLIMGHSCGNSDRTLLNTVFEHENCVSIKPYYYKKKDGSDNYLEIVQNMSRSFTNMRLYRDRVVNKEQCQSI